MLYYRTEVLFMDNQIILRELTDYIKDICKISIEDIIIISYLLIIYAYLLTHPIAALTIYQS